MNTVGKIFFRHTRSSIAVTLLRSSVSVRRLEENRYGVTLQPATSFLPYSKFFSSNSNTSQPRESFEDFRSREVQKEQEKNERKPTETSSNNSQKNNNENEKVLAVKTAILNAALSFVPTYGWSKQSVAKGALSIDYPTVINGLFPRGGVELVQHFYGQCNEELLDHLKQEAAGAERVRNPTEFARNAIEVRLRMLIPYIKHWPQALGLMTLPPNVPTSLANVLTLVDDICYYAGDRSVDFNWYTRRIGLATIYKATELYMLQDHSADYEKTWKFLDRRMEEASLVHDFLVKSEDATSHLQSAVGSAFSTARNILGLNFERR
ncbi:ubiquinone biosynthesis protein COQ9, mitochondrial-like isoform X2 [Topomyia yanbarensis]|uniref:ubiquinone biosynthesis protein COQ9, mitochondrial-like isoform X2 n=1 Tax=Topomyia yanbarensis TaxID=2498891 RepID=UPI00273CDFBD|nr:ubiquinone biosynthesis protein COQ9, mitochondrial-like isoform X2 [Topomyia yanbarensis]